MAKKHDVVITGMGQISSLGISSQELINNLISSKSGIQCWTSPMLTKQFPAALVPHNFSDEFKKLELTYLDRCSQMAVLAARQAITDAGLDQFTEYAQRAGLFYGTVRAGSEIEELMFKDFLIEKKETSRPYAIFAIMHNAAAAQISIRHQILGPVMTHSSACASSAVAIGDAYRAIRDGYLDIAIAGGAEAPLTASMFSAWDGTRALATPNTNDVGQSCRPFSKNRSGLVFGEGAGFVILESAEHAKKRNSACYATLSGYGIASDGYHIGTPIADGQIIAMRAALQDAGLESEAIQYLNAHATGTRGGDIVESNAIKAVFGETSKAPLVSSTKSTHGHLLGAGSVLELIITTLAITESILPATINLDEVDADCVTLNHIANSPILDRTTDRAMSFSSGLGGTNVALVVSRNKDLLMKHFSAPIL